MEWEGLAEWWLDEVADPAYAEEVIPLAVSLLRPKPGERILDIGCGEGQVSRAVERTGASTVGLDGVESLARRHGRSLVALLPKLSALGDDRFDAAMVVLVLEHLEDSATLFEEAHRVVRPGGRLVLVVNHPVFTAPGSAPVTDPVDFEVFWRPGTYLDDGWSDERAGDGTMRFYHRPLGRLLSQAADAGWSLVRLEERGVGDGQVARDPMLGDQRHIPRLLGAAWVAP